MRRFLLVLAVVLSACSDSTGPDTDEVVGTYTLETIDGDTMPFLLISVGGLFQTIQLAGTMTLNADNSYVESADLQHAFLDGTGQLVVEDTTVILQGRWELEDSAIVLTQTNTGGVLFGVASQATLTLHYESQDDNLTTYFYKKSGGSVARRPQVTYRNPSSASITGSTAGSTFVSPSTTRLLTTTSSTIGLRSITTSSVASDRKSAGRASTSRTSSLPATGSSP